MCVLFVRLLCLRSGREYHKNDPAVTVDYNTADPVVRWDSYENFNQRYQDSLEGNLCLNVSKVGLYFQTMGPT